MLAGLDDIEWGGLSHAYGPADDVPGMIRALLSDDRTVWDRALQNLFSTIWHQGTVYPATAPAVPFLLELLAAPGVGVEVKEAIFHLLGCIGDSIEHAGTSSILLDGPGEPDPELARFDRENRDRERGSARVAREAVEDGVGTYLERLDDEEPKVRDAAMAMLGLCVSRSARVIPVLLARIAGQADPRTRAALILAVGDLTAEAREPGPFLALFADRMRPEEHPVVRLAAATCLGRSSPDEPTTEVLDTICETASTAWRDFDTISGHTAGRVGQALKGDPAARLRVFLAALGSRDEAASKGARFALERMCHERRSVTPAIAAALAERIAAADLEERRGLVLTLAGLGAGAAAAAGPLALALDDADPQVRTWAAVAMAYLRDPRAIPVIIERLREDRQFPFIATTVGGFGAEARAAVPALVHVLGHPPADRVGDPRIQAAEALGRIGPDAASAIPALVALMEEDPGAGAHVAQAIGEIGGPEARATIPALKGLLESPDEGCRARAARALWRIDGRAGPALEVLRECLRPRSWARSVAAQAVGEMGEAARGEVPALLDCLEDRTPHGWATRIEAAIALWRIEPRAERTIPVLMGLFRHPGAQAPIATRAAEGLGAMGAEAREAVPLLRELAAADVRPFGEMFRSYNRFVIEDEAFRSAVDEALRRIEGDA